MKKKVTFKELAVDYAVSLLAGILVGFGLYYFSKHNGFAPGGISGIAFILSWYLPFQVDAGWYLLILNLPFIIPLSIFVERKLGFNVAFYILVQSAVLVVLEELDVPYYTAENGNLIFACIGAGVLSGAGYGIQIRHNGSSGGTYAISALIKHWHPAANIAWLSFLMDCSVVFLVFFLGQCNVEITICTIANLFLANLVVDYCIQGSKEGYKFEIITDSPDELSSEIMSTLMHGVTELNVQGMYTHKNKYMIVCIVRKRELSKMMRIIKKYNGTFSSFSKVNEVIGNFKK